MAGGRTAFSRRAVPRRIITVTATIESRRRKIMKIPPCSKKRNALVRAEAKNRSINLKGW
jgi:hypothetical protein